MVKKVLSIVLAVCLVATMSVTVLASGFTKSAEKKEVPEIIPQKGNDGKDYIAIIVDKDGNEVIGVPKGYLQIIPISELATLDNKLSKEEAKIFKDAAEQIKNTEYVKDLSPELKTILKRLYPDLELDTLRVSDLLYIDVEGVYAEYLSKEGNVMRIRLNLDTIASSLIAILFNNGGTIWKTIDDNNVTRGQGGMVELLVSDEGVYAFLRDSGELPPVNPDGPSSPDTGDTTLWMVLGAAGILALLAAVCFAVKKHSAQKA